MIVLEYDCVRNSPIVGLLDLLDMRMVVVWGGLEVPYVDEVIGPGGACIGFLMYEYSAYHWDKGDSVLVEGSKHCRIGLYGVCCI